MRTETGSSGNDEDCYAEFGIKSKAAEDSGDSAVNIDWQAFPRLSF
jgi:hypothetical protein